MTRRQVTVVESNLSGEAADCEVTFTYNGVAYRLDLTDTEAKQFQEVLTPYIAAAEIVRRRGGPRPTRTANVAEVRSWAGKNGIELNATGRIPNDVWEKYEAAQKPPPTQGRRRAS